LVTAFLFEPGSLLQWQVQALPTCTAAQVHADQIAGTLVALCVPIAGATNWTVTQNSHAKGHDVDLVPAVFVGAVLSCLVTLPLAFPFQATAHDLGLLSFLGVFQLAIPCVLSVLCARCAQGSGGFTACIAGSAVSAFCWRGWERVRSPGPTVLVGGTLVIGALVVNELVGWKQRSTQA
jgi:hypothetical protein